MLNRTWAVVEKKKINKNKICQDSKFFTKITKFLPKFITKILLFNLFKSAPSFDWAFKRIWVLIGSPVPMAVRLIGHLGYLKKTVLWIWVDLEMGWRPETYYHWFLSVSVLCASDIPVTSMSPANYAANLPGNLS